MAAIDSLLSLIEAQKATGIVLRAREPPVLIGGTGRGLTMPALGPELIETFAEEVLSATDLAQLRATHACDAVYRSAQHGPFTVEARVSSDKMSLKLRRGTTAVTKPSSPSAATTASSETPDVQPKFDFPASTAERSSVSVARDPALVHPHSLQLAASSQIARQIARAVDETVSDILVSAEQPMWIRSTMGLRSTGDEATSATEVVNFVDMLLSPAQRQRLSQTGSVDLAWEGSAINHGEPRRFRINIFHQTHGLAIAFRPIGQRAPSLAELHLPDSVGALGILEGGLVLVVGTAGSGKTTTLSAIVEEVNRTHARHILTLEDPIEFIYKPLRSLIHQREVGTHLESFAEGLRAALRECPDIILVGEMRDRDTIAQALTAAETGHLVLSTLHSGSAPMAIDRIIDVFPEHQQAQIRVQVAGSLRAVLTQKLLPGTLPGTRFPALEMLTVNYAVAALIREGKTHQLATQIQTGRDDGMVALEASLFDLLRANRISRETALAAARDPVELQRRIREAKA